MLQLVMDLDNVKAERDETNLLAGDDAPPVYPDQVIAIQTGTFLCNVLDTYCTQLVHYWR